MVKDEEKESFDVMFSVGDVKRVMKALMKTFQSGKDEPIKTVGLALTVAEIEVLLYRDLISKYCTNIDEVIERVGWQAKERAKYFHENG